MTKYFSGPLRILWTSLPLAQTTYVTAPLYFYISYYSDISTYSVIETAYNNYLFIYVGFLIVIQEIGWQVDQPLSASHLAGAVAQVGQRYTPSSSAHHT